MYEAYWPSCRKICGPFCKLRGGVRKTYRKDTRLGGVSREKNLVWARVLESEADAQHADLNHKGVQTHARTQCIHPKTHTHTHLHTQVRIYTHTLTHTSTHIHTQVHTYTHRQCCWCVSTSTCNSTCTQAHVRATVRFNKPIHPAYMCSHGNPQT
jgi:hypothetical protein